MQDSYDRANMPAEPSTPMGSGVQRRRLEPSTPEVIDPAALYIPPSTPEQLDQESDPMQAFGMHLLRRRFDTGMGRRRL